ncbi:MAG: AlbA family DNA-binding domain-containing protein [Bacilli bacterium]
MTDSLYELIGQPESSNLEYQAVLPPSRSIAMLIGAMANTEGGYIVLGVAEDPVKGIEVIGLSEDFRANSITHKALDLLRPSPKVHYQYVEYQRKKVYAIRVDKSDTTVTLEEKIFVRDGSTIRIQNPKEIHSNIKGLTWTTNIDENLKIYRANATDSMTKLMDHYQGVIRIINNLGEILYPEGIHMPSGNQEGKILSRILFSSIVDTFETYLSDLLFEIFLANPETLKSKQQVTVEEVLNCSDLQEFVEYWAKQKLSKLQKGSVKGFIKDNQQIRDLGILDDAKQNEIERILQIRHLYSHRNGIVDEKFLQYFTGQYTLNSEHQMSVQEICDTCLDLASTTNEIDSAAADKYKLARLN